MEIFLNGIKHFLNLDKQNKNLTVLQGVLLLGEEIPRFCFHEKLSIAGNCRMCLVEISQPKNLKPCASCALPLVDEMIVFTNTVLVKKAREGVLEFLLANHPLDCPICDQGGECDLQDQSLFFGSDRGRFYEDKRSVEDKDCGPFIKTVMTRCIHCTRCIRYIKEIVGHNDFGVLGRGNFMEIGSFIQGLMYSEISGNVIDICPVGALTSKPYSFTARPWELRSFETIDVTDSLCSRIRVDLKGFEVMRILPSINESLNQHWILDRIRFSYDSFVKQRLSYPLIRCFFFEKGSFDFLKLSWLSVFVLLSVNLYYYFLALDPDFIEFEVLPDDILLSTFIYKNISFISFFGDLLDNQTLVILADFVWYFFSECVFSQVVNLSLSSFNVDYRCNYMLNLDLSLLENIDFCFFVFVNPRLDFPLLNLRLRKAYVKNYSIFFSNQFLTNLTYFFFQQGNNFVSFFNFFKGKSFAIKSLIFATFPIFLIGSFFLRNFSNSFFFNFFFKYISCTFNKGFSSINFLLESSSEVFSREVGLHSFFDFSTGLLNSFNYFPKFFYFCNVDFFPFYLKNKSGVCNFLLYQGFIGSSFLNFFDVILPGCSFLEKESFYVNLQGKYQRTKMVLVPPNQVFTDWFTMHCFRTLFYGFSYYHFFYVHMNNSVHIFDYMFFNRVFEILNIDFILNLNKINIRNLLLDFVLYFNFFNDFFIKKVFFNYKLFNLIWFVNHFNHYTKNLFFYNSSKIMEIAFLFDKKQQNFID